MSSGSFSESGMTSPGPCERADILDGPQFAPFQSFSPSTAQMEKLTTSEAAMQIPSPQYHPNSSRNSPPRQSSRSYKVIKAGERNDHNSTQCLTIPFTDTSGTCQPVSNQPITALRETIATSTSADLEKLKGGQMFSEEERPPDGGYGWVCVGCNFAVIACTWGLNGAYGIYLAHYLSTNLHPNATPLDYAFIGGLSFSVSMLAGPPTTFLFRHGWTTQSIMALGIILETSALIGASFTSHSLIGLFFTQGVLFGLGLGFLYIASIGTISQWFHKKRSVANGICAGGAGLGGLIFSLSTNAMIQNISLQWAFRITAIITFTVNTIATILLRDRNKFVQPRQNPFDLSLFKARPEFSLVLLWGFFSLLGYIVILFSLADYARTINLSPKQGSIMASMLSLGMMFGRPLVGLLSDTYGRINVSILATFASAVSVFALWMVGHLGGFAVCIIFALVNGAVCGTFWTTVAPVATEIVGLKDLPSALSIILLSTVLPTTFSEPIALALRRPSLYHPGVPSNATYLHPQIFSGIMYLAATLCMYLLRVTVIRRKFEPKKILEHQKIPDTEEYNATSSPVSSSASNCTISRKTDDQPEDGDQEEKKRGSGKQNINENGIVEEKSLRLTWIRV